MTKNRCKNSHQINLIYIHPVNELEFKNKKMNFKKVLSVVLLAGVLFACDAPKKKEIKEVKKPAMEKKEAVKMGATRFEELKGYFVKNNVVFDSDYKFVAVSNQEDFDKYFGIAKTKNNEITALDFDKFNIAGILVKPSNKASKIEMTKYTSEGAKTIVGFTSVFGKEQNFTSGALMLFKIPKSRTSVDFVTGGKMVNVTVN